MKGWAGLFVLKSIKARRGRDNACVAPTPAGTNQIRSLINTRIPQLISPANYPGMNSRLQSWSSAGQTVHSEDWCSSESLVFRDAAFSLNNQNLRDLRLLTFGFWLLSFDL